MGVFIIYQFRANWICWKVKKIQLFPPVTSRVIGRKSSLLADSAFATIGWLAFGELLCFQSQISISLEYIKPQPVSVTWTIPSAQIHPVLAGQQGRRLSQQSLKNWTFGPSNLKCYFIGSLSRTHRRAGILGCCFCWFWDTVSVFQTFWGVCCCLYVSPTLSW